MRTFIISLIVYTFLIGCAIDKKEVNNADTVYISGKIYTVNEDSPWVEAVAIREGKFIKVGSNAEAESFVGEKTEDYALEVIEIAQDLLQLLHDTQSKIPEFKICLLASEELGRPQDS